MKSLKRRKSIYIAAACILLGLACFSPQAPAHDFDAPFPRLMGMNIGEKNYDDPQYQKALSRLNVVILGLYPGWKSNYSYKNYHGIRAAARAIKDKNPNILLGQYTILNDAQPASDPKYAAQIDKAEKIDQENWWLRRADGTRVQWTSLFNTYDVNITNFTHPDAHGDRWPQWLAQRDYKKYFKPVPEFDIWYFDNVFEKSRIPRADWDNDGIDEKNTDRRIAAAYRAGHVAEWQRARQLRPDILLIGNADHDLSMPEYRGKLNGAFLEGMMGKPWSIERRKGWKAMMARYHAVVLNTEAPKIVGFNVWGHPTDYKFFRYAFTSTLMDDGYFSFTDKKVGYSSAPWFDEYNVKLGKPLQGPQTRPWQHGIYRRVFENGMALVNPSWHRVTVKVGPGYKHISGAQDPGINNGKPVTTVTLSPKEGMLLYRPQKQ